MTVIKNDLDVIPSLRRQRAPAEASEGPREGQRPAGALGGAASASDAGGLGPGRRLHAPATPGPPPEPLAPLALPEGCQTPHLSRQLCEDLGTGNRAGHYVPMDVARPGGWGLGATGHALAHRVCLPVGLCADGPVCPRRRTTRDRTPGRLLAAALGAPCPVRTDPRGRRGPQRVPPGHLRSGRGGPDRQVRELPLGPARPVTAP